MGKFENKKDRTVDVESGHAVILKLDDIDSVPKPSITWEWQEESIKNDVKYYKSMKNDLVIFSVDQYDEGKRFRAVAINSQLTTIERSAHTILRVTGSPYADVEPEIIIPLEDTTAVEGKEIEFECVGNARDLHLMDTFWFKDKIPIENANIVYDLGWRNRTLILHKVAADYAGEYSCKIQIKTDNMKSKISKAMLTVIDVPRFRQLPQLEFETEYGKSLEIPCDVSGNPAPVVKWFRNAKEIDLHAGEYKTRDDGALVIERVSLSDSAMFQCLAINDAGETSSNMWVRVKSELAIC
jgi:protein sidekick